MLPGYQFNDPRLLTDECKALLKGVQVLRLMAQSGCNQSFERFWQYRTPANAPYQARVYNSTRNQSIDIFTDNTPNNDTYDNSPYEARAYNPWLANSFDQQRHYPWEKAIDVCNYLDKDFYANVPVLMDNNYAQELSKLLKQRLKPNLNVYIEIGTELWNFGGGGAFLGFAMSLSAVHQMVAVEGDRTIMGGFNGIEAETGSVGTGKWWGGSELNAWTAFRRWPSYRLKQYMDIFAQDWGFAEQGGVGKRVRAVLAGQLAYGWGNDYWFIGGEGLDFFNKAFGSPNKYIYAIANAHYNSFHYPDNLTTEALKTMSVDNIYKEFYANTQKQFGQFGQETQNGNPFNANGSINMNSNADCEGNELVDIVSIALFHQVKIIAYEGGHEFNTRIMGRWIPLNNMVAALNDQRIYDNILTSTNKWYNWMGQDALFIKNGFYAEKGYGNGYAVTQNIDEESLQLKAYRQVMQTPIAPRNLERGGTIGISNKSLLPGWQIASYRCREYRSSLWPNNSYGPSGRRTLKGQNIFPVETYLIDNKTAGKYSLRLNVLWVKPDNKYDMYMDGKPIKKDWSFKGNPNGGEYPNWSDTIQVYIPFGMHAIRFINTSKTKDSIQVYQFEYNLLEKTDCNITAQEETNSTASPANALSLAPNPSEGIFHVSNHSNLAKEIAIFNTKGEELMQFDIPAKGSREINLHNQAKGLYLIRSKHHKEQALKILIQ
jgi:hypothetical protein